jgi:hypothetical protein
MSMKAHRSRLVKKNQTRTTNNMAKLSYEERKKMPKGEFALPAKKEGGKGGYPINDKAHARNALSRVAQNGSSAEKAEVKAKVHKKFPGIDKKRGTSDGYMTR